MKFTQIQKLTSVAVVALMFGLSSCKDDLDSKNNADAVKADQEAAAYPGSGTNPCASIDITQGLPVDTIFRTATAAGQDTIITTNVTWNSDKIHYIKGNLRFQAPAILTIAAGTIVKGDKNTTGTIVIERGAQIFANGTITNPVVMTSGQPEGTRIPGDWGGLAICGNALVNVPGGTTTLEGFTVGTNPIIYGGTNDADNSGSLRFLRVEYAGKELTPNNEKNGITCAGVGCNTRIDHIMISYGKDDAIEWFGGSVSSKYIFTYGTQDDDFDSDFGFSGVNQFLIGYRIPAIADVSGSNGIESDGSDVCDDTRTTTAIYSHVTLVGPDDQTTQAPAPTAPGVWNAGINIRRNSGIDIHNSVIVGWHRGVDVDDQNTSNNLLAGCPDACPAGRKPLRFKNNTIYKLSTYASTFATFGTFSGGAGCGAPSAVVSCLLDSLAPNYNFTRNLSDLNSLAKWKPSLWNRGCPNLTITDNVSELLSYDNTPNARPKGTNVANICQPACTGAIGAINPVSYFRGAKGAFDNGWKYYQGWLSFTPQTNNYN